MQLPSTILFIISLTIALAYVSQMLCFQYGFTHNKLSIKYAQTLKTTVSIIVAARNEELTIVACIQSLLAQKYPAHLMEIIVVNDNSTDTTVLKLNTLLKTTDRIKFISLDPDCEKGKKAAVAKAIAHATHELIITTDADCKVGTEWVSTIVRHYEQRNSKMLLGPVVFYGEYSIFEKIQSLEFMALMGVTVGAANMQWPLLCNGANLAYPKSTFVEFNDFSNQLNLASGDDMLLMQNVKNKQRKAIDFVMDNRALVKTKAQPTLKKFIAQRKRWFTKNLVVRDPFISIVGLIVFLMCALIITNAVIGMITGSIIFFYYGLLLLIIKSLIDFIFLYTVSQFFKKTNLLLYFPLAQVFIILYTFLLPFTLLYTKTYSWKDRVVK